MSIYVGEDGHARYRLTTGEIRLMPTELRELPDRGWDWNDLAYALGFGTWNTEYNWIACDFSEDDLLMLVQARIEHGDNEVLALVRRFLETFVAFCQTEGHGHHELPLWEGLLMVEDDFTFRKYAALLVGHWWD